MRKNISAKAACKMFMKLTPGVFVLVSVSVFGCSKIVCRCVREKAERDRERK